MIWLCIDKKMKLFYPNDCLKCWNFYRFFFVSFTLYIVTLNSCRETHTLNYINRNKSPQIFFHLINLFRVVSFSVWKTFLFLSWRPIGLLISICSRCFIVSPLFITFCSTNFIETIINYNITYWYNIPFSQRYTQFH